MNHVLELEGVTFAYPRTQLGVRGVDLRVARGEMVGVLGPNGSGKTTLLKLVVGPEAVDHVGHDGSVRLVGRRADALSARQRAQHVAYVPQQIPDSLALTCREVVAMGRFPHLGWFAAAALLDGDPVARDAMGLCRVEPLAERVFAEISGGERQRVMLASALAQQTELLVLDEPTSALDVQFGLEILEILRRLVDGGRAVLMSSHDVNLASAFCDRLVVLDGGVVVADGPPVDVLTEALLAEVYGIEVDLVALPGREAPVVVPRRRGGPAGKARGVSAISNESGSGGEA